MAGFFDRLNQELEVYGKRAQQALDEGRLQVEKFRVKRERDEAAKQLGYLFHRREKGQAVDALEIDAWIRRIDVSNDSLERIERSMAAMRPDGVTVSDAPAAAPAPDAEVVK